MYTHATVKQSSETPTRYPIVLNSVSQYMGERCFSRTPGNPSLAHQEVVSYVMYEPPTKKSRYLTAAIVNTADNGNLAEKKIITQE